MIPEMYKNHMFNDWDYLPEDYKVDDPVREQMLKELVLKYSTDPEYLTPDAIKIGRASCRERV